MWNPFGRARVSAKAREDWYAARQHPIGADCKRTVAAVGEFYRRPEGEAAARRVVQGGTVAVLEPEPDNPADPFAVKVVVLGHHVGYLSAEHAREYHPVLELAGAHGELLATRVRTRIYETHVDGEEVGVNGFQLLLPTVVRATRELESAYGGTPVE